MTRFILAGSLLTLVALFGCSGDTPPRTTSPGPGGAGGTNTVSGGGGTATTTGNASTTSSSASTGGAGGTGGGSTTGTAGNAGTGIDAAGGATGGGGPGGTGGGGGSAAMDAGSDAAGPTCTPGTGTVDVGTKSIMDRKTCLVWEKASSGSMTNKQAAKYCDQLSQDGMSDWRVAAPEELATWPNLSANGNAYVTNPIYIPKTSASDQEGCTGNSHSCNLTEYNAGSHGCTWQGVSFSGPVVCVRGTAQPGTTASMYAATACALCSPHVTGATADFKVADCLPFAN